MFENGDLVTVSNSHPEHNQWFGVILCNNIEEPNKFSNFRNIFALDSNYVYYIVFGPSFDPKSSYKFHKHLFLDSNIKKIEI